MILFDSKSLKKLSKTELSNLLLKHGGESVGAAIGDDLPDDTRKVLEERNIQVLSASRPAREIHALAIKHANDETVTIVSDSPLTLCALEKSDNISVESVSELVRYDQGNIQGKLGIQASQVLDFLYLAGSPDLGIKSWAITSPQNIIRWLKSEEHSSICKIMRSDSSPARDLPGYKSMEKSAPDVLDQYQKAKAALSQEPTVKIDMGVTMIPPSENDIELDDSDRLDTINSLAAFLIKTKRTPLSIALKGDSFKARPQDCTMPEIIRGTQEVVLYSAEYGERTIALKKFRNQEKRLKELLVDNLAQRDTPAVTDYSKGVYGFLGPKSFTSDLKLDDVVVLAYTLDNRNRDMSAEQVLQANKVEESENFNDRLIKGFEFLRNKGHEDLYRSNFGHYEKTERHFAKVLAEMEYQGVPVNTTVLNQNDKALRLEAAKIRKDIEKEAGCTVKLDDNGLRKLLFEDLKLNPPMKTSTGLASVKEEALEALRETTPIIEKIEKFRSIQTVLSKGFEPVKRHLNRKSGCIHALFDQTKTSTGRLSCSNPALQALPASFIGMKLREAFQAEHARSRSQNKKWFVKADYSQAEMYVLASLSGCSRLMNILSSGEDIHRATAAEVFNKAPDDVSTEERRAAKAINFGLIYGLTPFGLSSRLKITVKEAEKHIDTYFRKFPTIKTYLDMVKEHANMDSSVIAGDGRRIFLNRTSNERRAVNEMHRKAVNAPMQGTVADLIKQSMVSIDQELKKRWPSKQARICMQVHDEIIVLVDDEIVKDVQEIIQKAMGSVNIALPPKVDFEIGPTLEKQSEDLQKVAAMEVNQDVK